MKNNKQRLFYCYSERMLRALLNNGFQYIREGTNINNGATFWVFEGTEELNYYKNHVYQTERDRY